LRFRALPVPTLGVQMHLPLHLERDGGLQLQLHPSVYNVACR
jgi:hypothetical protein